MLNDGLHMFLGRISHIPFPSVLRIFLRQFSHIFVPVCLGQYGSCRNGCKLCISLDHALVGITVKGLEPVAVDQKEFRLHRQSSDSPLHPRYGSIQNIDGVDFLCTHLLYSPGQRLLLDDRAQQFPGLFGHFLRVVQKGMMEVLGKNDCSGENGSGQRASSGFVASGLDEVFMKTVQKVQFIAHSAKIHNLFNLTKSFLEHFDDFVLGGYGFLKSVHESFQIGDPRIQSGDMASVFLPHILQNHPFDLRRPVSQNNLFGGSFKKICQLHYISIDYGCAAFFKVAVRSHGDAKPVRHLFLGDFPIFSDSADIVFYGNIVHTPSFGKPKNKIIG